MKTCRFCGKRFIFSRSLDAHLESHARLNRRVANSRWSDNLSRSTDDQYAGVIPVVMPDMTGPALSYHGGGGEFSGGGASGSWDSGSSADFSNVSSGSDTSYSSCGDSGSFSGGGD